jgi:urease accessory protein
MSKTRALPAAGLLFWLMATPAFAHHALGGKLPIDFGTGFLSGLAHPVINVDHFAFVIAIGVLTAVAQGSRLLPIWFVGGTVLGCLASVQGLPVPFIAWAVPVSVAIVGVALALGRSRLGAWDIGFFLVAGFLHGALYAQAIIGSENNSLRGYLLGFAIIQTVVAMGAMSAAYALWCGDKLYANARVVGGVVAGVGLTILVQTGMAALLPLP